MCKLHDILATSIFCALLGSVSIGVDGSLAPFITASLNELCESEYPAEQEETSKEESDAARFSTQRRSHPSRTQTMAPRQSGVVDALAVYAVGGHRLFNGIRAPMRT